MKIWKPIAATFVALVVSAAVVSVDPLEAGPTLRDQGLDSTVSTAPSPPPSTLGGPEMTEIDDDHRAVAVMAPDGEEPAVADPTDVLSERLRVRVLRREFRLAADAIREGDESEHVRREAESALSALRGELYASTGGRDLHQRLEAELDALIVLHTGEAR